MAGSTIHWLDYSYVPVARRCCEGKHLSIFELIVRTYVVLFIFLNMAVTKGFLVSGLLWSLQVALEHTGQKHQLHALRLYFSEVLSLPLVADVYSQLLTYQSPQCDHLHFHLYQFCVTLHPDDHGEFSHIPSSCQMCLWVLKSCQSTQLGASMVSALSL